MVILIMGPPGVGKGTQAQRLCEAFNLAHLSTGDILRAQVQQKTALGQAAQEKMAAGALVPDQLIIDMMLDQMRQSEGAVLLDGFPRTREQAEALAAAGVDITAVIDLDADDETIVRRLGGRFIHPASGRSYHSEFSPPKTPGSDDISGEPLVQRADDQPDTVRARLAVYREQTAPLKIYYQQQETDGKTRYIAVDGGQEIDSLAAQLVRQLRAALPE